MILVGCRVCNVNKQKSVCLRKWPHCLNLVFRRTHLFIKDSDDAFDTVKEIVCVEFS